jgi:hypothetical protein
MVGLGFASGVILNLVNHRRQLDQLPWSDPVVWRSAALLGWLVSAVVFNAAYKPARRGRKVAYLTVATFVFLVASLAVRLTVNTEHSKQADSAEASATTEVRP